MQYNQFVTGDIQFTSGKYNINL